MNKNYKMGFNSGSLKFTSILHGKSDRILAVKILKNFDTVLRLTDKNVLFDVNGRSSFDKIEKEELEIYKFSPEYSIGEVSHAKNNGILIIGKKEKHNGLF